MFKKILCAIVIFQAFNLNSFASQNFNKKEIKIAKEQMIQNSINSYSGNCPCPYNLARNRTRCGKRSAYSRPGGYSPLCYIEDISDSEAINYLNKNKK